jgi:hypothetical protein
MSGAVDLAAILESSSEPSELLDSMLDFWGEQSSFSAPTRSLEAAISFVDAIAKGTLWTLAMRPARLSATITSLGEQVMCVSAEGSTPALALLAAFVRAKDKGPKC